MQIRLSEVIEAIDNTDVNHQYFYYIPEERIILKDDDIKEKYLIALPSHKQIDDYGTMEAFIDEKCDGEAGEWLREAIKGPGAFRRFRMTLNRFSLTEQWLDYLYDVHEGIAMDWCDYYGIEYLDDEPFALHNSEKSDHRIIDAKHNYRLITINKDNVYSLSYLCLDFRKTLAHFKNQKYNKDVDECVEELNYYLDRNYPIFAISDNGKYIGYCVCRIDNDVVFLESLFVSEGYRRKGIGKMLLEKAQSIGKEYGNETLYMSVHPNNDEMLSFLKGNGYDVLNLLEIRKAYHDEENNDSYTIGNNSFRY